MTKQTRGITKKKCRYDDDGDFDYSKKPTKAKKKPAKKKPGKKK